MKKLFFAGLLSVCALGLISCLEGGSNMQSRSGVPGIVQFDKNMRMVIMSPDFYPYPFYDPSIAALELDPGDCIFFGYAVDFNDENNINYQTTGYIQGTLSGQPIVVDEYPCNSYLEKDTSALIPNEQAVAYATSSNGYSIFFLDKLFLSSDVTMDTDQKTWWYLYHDSTLPVKEVDGKRVYTLFLRAEITYPGKKPVINGYTTNVFDTKRFVDTIMSLEKAEGNSTAYFQILHINEIKDDSTYTWAQSEIIPINIAEE
ncbi:MAG: hypothetical protein LBB84_11190 [Tannerellaceae bacterium]|jgi:hypothetical protein|nr:hypothetical protein [Tannerellaceae bacterium]